MGRSYSIASNACKLVVAGALLALPLGPFTWGEAWASGTSTLEVKSATDDQTAWSFDFPARVALNQSLKVTAKLPVPKADDTKTDAASGSAAGGSTGSGTAEEPSYTGLLQYYDNNAEPVTLGSAVTAVKQDGYYVLSFDCKVVPLSDVEHGGWAEAQRTIFALTVYSGSTAVALETRYINIEPASRTVTFNTAVAADDIDQPTLATKSIEATYGRSYSYDPDSTDSTGLERKLPVPTRPNYDFAGWYTSYDSKTGAYGQQVTEDTVFSGTSNTTLYAKWTGKKYEVLLLGDSRKDNRQGHIDARSIYVTYGETYRDLAAVTGTGSTGKYTELRGWTDYNGNPVLPTDKVIDKDAEHRTWTYGTQLLYAVWGEARTSIEDDPSTPDVDEGVEVTGIEETYPYKGKEIVPSNIKVTLPELKDADGNVTRQAQELVYGEDFTVECKDNVEISTSTSKATVTITGAGHYKGSVERSFNIVTGTPYFEVEGRDAQANQFFDFSFSGSGSMVIKNKLVTDATTKPVYKIESSDADKDAVSIDADGNITVKRPVSAVKVTATAAAGKKYVATPEEGVSFTFSVGKSKLGASNVALSATSFAYTGKKLVPKVTVKNALGKTLAEGVDYKVKLSGGCKKVGAYKVSVAGLNGYNCNVSKSFTIAPKKPGSLKAKRYGSQKVKGKTYGLYNLSWGKVSGASSYQVYRTVGAKTAKSTFNAKTTSKKFGWQKGKTVAVKVRACQKVGGKKYYSAWKTINVKAK